MELKKKKKKPTDFILMHFPCTKNSMVVETIFGQLKDRRVSLLFVDAGTCGTDRPKMDSSLLDFFVYGMCINMKRAVSFYWALLQILAFKYRMGWNLLRAMCSKLLLYEKPINFVWKRIDCAELFNPTWSIKTCTWCLGYLSSLNDWFCNRMMSFHHHWH